MRKVFEIQKKVGVEVYCIDSKDSDLDKKRHKRFILVADNKKFAWEVKLDENNEFSEVEITVNPKEVEEYLKIFVELKMMSSFKPCDQFLQGLIKT